MKKTPKLLWILFALISHGIIFTLGDIILYKKAYEVAVFKFIFALIDIPIPNHVFLIIIVKLALPFSALSIFILYISTYIYYLLPFRVKMISLKEVLSSIIFMLISCIVASMALLAINSLAMILKYSLLDRELFLRNILIYNLPFSTAFIVNYYYLSKMFKYRLQYISKKTGINLDTVEEKAINYYIIFFQDELCKLRNTRFIKHIRNNFSLKVFLKGLKELVQLSVGITTLIAFLFLLEQSKKSNNLYALENFPKKIEFIEKQLVDNFFYTPYGIMQYNPELNWDEPLFYYEDELNVISYIYYKKINNKYKLYETERFPLIYNKSKILNEYQRIRDMMTQLKKYGNVSHFLSFQYYDLKKTKYTISEIFPSKEEFDIIQKEMETLYLKEAREFIYLYEEKIRIEKLYEKALLDL